MEAIHIEPFAREGQPNFTIDGSVDGGLHLNLSKATFNLTLEIVGVGHNRSYPFVYNNDSKTPLLFPETGIQRFQGVSFENFSFELNYTFRIRLDINSTDPVIRDTVFFGGDNQVEGWLLPTEKRGDHLDYGSEDFEFYGANHIGRDELFNAADNLVFRIGDSGVSD